MYPRSSPKLLTFLAGRKNKKKTIVEMSTALQCTHSGTCTSIHCVLCTHVLNSGIFVYCPTGRVLTSLFD